MVGQLKSGGFTGLLIKMFKAWSARGSYFCASFLRIFLFIVICFLFPLANVCLCEKREPSWAENSSNAYPWLFPYPHAINYRPGWQPWDQLRRKWKHIGVKAKPGRTLLGLVSRRTLRPRAAIHLQWQSLSRGSSGLPTPFQRGCVCSQSHSNPYSLP